MLNNIILHPKQIESLRFVKEDSRFSKLVIKNGIAYYSTLETHMYTTVDLDNVVSLLRMAHPEIEAIVVDNRMVYVSMDKTYEEVSQVTSNIIKDSKESILTRCRKAMASILRAS